MKTLKYLLSAAMVAAIATSCNDDDYIDETSSSVSPESNYEFSAAELEKMAYGCEYYLDENNAEKIETRATDEYLSYIKCQMDSFEQASVKTSHLKAAGIGYVGVLKEGTCNGYGELDFLYDCEDNKPASVLSGYASDISTQRQVGGDLYFKFCAVPASLFGSIGENYAVLRLSEDVLENNGHYKYHINVLLDAEDKYPTTAIFFAPVRWTNDKDANDKANAQYFKPNRIDSNGNLYLSLERFTPDNDTDLPDLGMNYGVFGTLRNRYHGYIQTDDEDKRNANSIEEDYYKPTETSSYAVRYIGDELVYGIIHGGKNTCFHISQVKAKKN